MNELEKLLAKREVLLDEQKALIAKDELTEDEDKRCDDIDGLVDGIEKNIKRLEKIAERDAFSAEPIGKPPVDDIPPADGTADIKDIDSFRAGDANILDKPWDNLQEFIDCAKRFNRNPDPRLMDYTKSDKENGFFRAAGSPTNVIKIDSDGGFLVDAETTKELWSKMHDSGQILSRVNQHTISNGNNRWVGKGIDEKSRVDGSRSGGIRAYWKDELEALTASKPTFFELDLEPKKLTALNYQSNEFVQDAASYRAEIDRFFEEEVTFKLEDAIVEGTGGDQPRGYMNATAKVTVDKEVDQAADTIVYENITNMFSRIWAPSATRAVWFINQDVFPQLASMALSVGTGGAAAYLPANGLSGKPYGTLMGLPVIPTEFNETIGTEGDIVLADLGQYEYATIGGLNVATSIHVAFVNDQSATRWTIRADGALRWNSALTPFKGTKTQSPIITLESR